MTKDEEYLKKQDYIDCVEYAQYKCHANMIPDEFNIQYAAAIQEYTKYLDYQATYKINEGRTDYKDGWAMAAHECRTKFLEMFCMNEGQ